MKKLLLASMFLALVNLGFADTPLMNYVPKDANVLVSVDCGKIINLPLFKDLRQKNPEFDKTWVEIETKLKAQNLQMDKLIESALIYVATDKQSYGSIFKTQVKEGQMEKLFADMASPLATVDGSLIKGKKVFLLKNQDYGSNPFAAALAQGALPERFSAMLYLKDDIVIMTEKDKLLNALDLIKNENVSSNKSLMARKGLIDKNAILWAAFEMPAQNASSPSDASSSAPQNGIKGGTFSMSFTGKEQRDISADVSVECKDAQSAMMYAMQAQGSIMMGLSMSGNPQLAAEMGNAIKIEAKDKNIIAKIAVSKALQDNIEKMIKEGQSAPGKGLPPPSAGATLPSVRKTN